jgi:hypothetical protein
MRRMNDYEIGLASGVLASGSSQRMLEKTSHSESRVSRASLTTVSDEGLAGSHRSGKNFAIGADSNATPITEMPTFARWSAIDAGATRDPQRAPRTTPFRP